MPSESEEKQREFFALRSLLRLSEIVRAVDERWLSWLHFSHLNRPSQCFTLVSSLFPPIFLVIYIANVFTFLPLPNFTPGFPPFYIAILTPVFFCLPSFFSPGLFQWQVHPGASRGPWKDRETKGPHRLAGKTIALKSHGTRWWKWQSIIRVQDSGNSAFASFFEIIYIKRCYILCILFP